MKLNKITIQGMHNIQAPKTYNLKDHNYFYGKNGAGKSTILQAIQLALLGYIPGYDKTNKGIYQHSNSKTMSVTLELLDNDKTITIERSWTKLGQSIKADTNLTGTDNKIEDITNGLILPVYDFNDFMKLSSNKMKEWFLEFLPSSTVEINWESEISNVTMNYPYSDNIKERILSYITQSDKDGKELILDLNSHIKELISYTKAQVDSTQNTIKELVRYDDAPIKSSEQIRDDINRLNQQKIDRERWLVNKERNQTLQTQLKWYEQTYSSDTVMNDPNLIKYENEIVNIRSKIYTMEEQHLLFKNKINELSEIVVELQHKLKAKKEIIQTDGICPLCKSHIEHLVESAKNEVAELQVEFDNKYNELQSLKQQYEDSHIEFSDLDKQYNQAVQNSNKIKNAYNEMQNLRSQLKDIEDRDDLNTNYDEMIKELTDDLIKIEANNKYDELVTKLTADKIRFENELDVLKELKKLTDVNGLQTKAISESPFNILKEKMDEILKAVFGPSYRSHFIEEGKSNSFDFGVIIDNTYVSYTTLSSGEKCMFTLAFTFALLSLSDCEIKVILVDDLFDHLDKDNANKLFTSLYNMKDNIQTVFAGVNKCENYDGVEIR